MADIVQQVWPDDKCQDVVAGGDDFCRELKCGIESTKAFLKNIGILEAIAKNCIHLTEQMPQCDTYQHNESGNVHTTE